MLVETLIVSVVLPLVLAVTAATAAAQDWGRLPVPKADRELIYNVVTIMNMPEGVHRIYNGKGSTMFDVVYTIRCRKKRMGGIRGRHGEHARCIVYNYVRRQGNMYDIQGRHEEPLRYTLYGGVYRPRNEAIQGRLVRCEPYIYI